MKRILVLILSILLIFMYTVPAFADTTADIVDSGTCGANGDNLTWTLTGADEYTLTISGSGAMKDYSNTGSNVPWKAYTSKISEVCIEEGVTSIGNGAFYYCDKAASFTFPASLTQIGDWAFYACQPAEIHISDLAAYLNINFKGSSSYPNYNKGSELYLNDEVITDLVVPEGVTSIPSKAFYGCKSIKSVTLPESVTSIGSFAFAECSMTSIEIPEGVTTIYEYTFKSCKKLSSITIPGSVTTIKNDAFFDSYEIRNVHIDDVSSYLQISFGNSASHPNDMVGANFYIGDEPLKEIIVPEGITNIPYHAFYGCESAVSLTIPEGVTSIGERAFGYCSGLKDIVIPDSVTSIDSYAFYECTSLENITLSESMTAIEAGVFCGCKGLSMVQIPMGIESIGSHAFSNCSGLKYLVIPDSIKSMGEHVIQFGIGYNNNFKSIIYYGKATDWSSISIGSDNDVLNSADRYEVSFMDPEYSGAPVLPDVTARLGDNALVLGTDYELSSETETVEVGSEGKAKVTFIGEHSDLPSVSSSYTVVNHDPIRTEAKAPTCTEDGNIEYWVCSNCGKIYSDAEGTQEITIEDTVIKATGHSWDEGQITTEPGCTEDGVKTYTCISCGETREESVPATGHSWDEGQITTAPGCTEEGVKTYTCISCGETREESVPATGHSWDEGQITTEPGCTEEGVKTYTCASCGLTRTESVPATDHSWDEGQITLQPGCTKDGVKTYTCVSCGLTRTESVPATGHSWDEGQITTEPTFTKEGVRTYTCKGCGQTRVESIPAIPHITVTFDPKEGSLNANQRMRTVAIGEPYGALPVPERKGFTFAGWQDQNGTIIRQDTVVKSTVDQTLTAVWNVNTYTVHFDGNSSTAGAMKDQSGLKYGEKYVLSANGFTRTGYDFKGWNTSPDGTGTAYADKASIESLTDKNGEKIVLYAQWEPKEYTITYMLEEGTNNEGNPEHFYSGSEAIVLQDPMRDGYTFNGWYTGADYQTPITSIEAGTENDVTVYAKWTLDAPKDFKWSKYGTGTKKIKIAWTANPAADGYTIYRATKKTGTYKRLGSTQKTSYTNLKLKTGKSYYYKVCSYILDSSGNKVYSDYTKTVKCTTLNPAKYTSYILNDFRWVKRHWKRSKVVKPGAYVGVFYNSDGDKCVLTYLCYKIGSKKKIWKEWYMHNLTGDLCPPMGTDPTDFYESKKNRAFGKAKIRYLNLHSDVLAMEAQILKAATKGNNTEVVAFKTAKYVNNRSK